MNSCAKRGTPDGGPLDENPPEIVREIPKNNSIYFNDEKIRIFFDEYIKLEKLNSQLVVSPPIDKSKYSIFPQGGASKYIDIEINESLKIVQLMFSILDKVFRTIMKVINYNFINMHSQLAHILIL